MNTLDKFYKERKSQKENELKNKDKDRPDKNYDDKQLAMGAEIEKEHTDNLDIARTIAKDHLDEIPDYYTRLKEMEAEAKEKGQKVDVGVPKSDVGVDAKLKDTIVQFFKATPPKSDKDVHAFAKKLGLPADEAEQMIYEILTELLTKKEEPYGS